MSIPKAVAALQQNHEEIFRDEVRVELLKRSDGPRRFRCLAYTGKDVSRAFGRMVIRTSGINRAEKTGMLLEHDDMLGVAVCDKHEINDQGYLYLDGYFLDDTASKGEAGALQAKIDQGWPMKMSVGIRFRRHSFVEDGVEFEINGRKLKGPMVVVDECDLFETSFIHANPADLDTGAALMRKENQMADVAEPEVKAPAETREQILEEGARKERERLRAEQELDEALMLAYPGKSEKVQLQRQQAKAQGATTAQLKDLALKRLQEKLSEKEKAEAEKAEALAALEKRAPSAGSRGFNRDAAQVVQTMTKAEERVWAELKARPQLAEIFKDEAERIVGAWLTTRGRLSTRDGKTPVLCDLLGGGAPVNAKTLAALQKMADDVRAGFEAQRLDVGSAGPDLSKVTVNGFQGMFYHSYEEELSKNWSQELSFQIASDQQAEIVRWLGAPPMIQQWKGPRIAKNIPIYQQLIQANKFEGTLDVDRFDWDHQKWDLIAKSFGLFGQVASQHWDLIFTQLLEANPTAYDAVALFSGSHTLGGDSGTIKNDVTSSGSAGTDSASKLAVADPTMPAQLEWANIILQLTPKFRSWAWANGIKMNGHARQWGIMVHPDFEGNLQAAISSERLDLGASNPLFGQRSQYRVIPNAFLTHKQYGYIFRLDTPNKPLLRTEPDPIEMMWMGPGSHLAFTEDKYSMGLRCVRGIAPGAFESCMRFTIGAA